MGGGEEQSDMVDEVDSSDVCVTIQHQKEIFCHFGKCDNLLSSCELDEKMTNTLSSVR